MCKKVTLNCLKLVFGLKAELVQALDVQISDVRMCK
jgi:hypothetical protein